MRLTRNDIKIDSIIEMTCGTLYKVTNPDHVDGAMCVKMVKTRKEWTKKERPLTLNADYSQIVKITK